MIRLYYNGHHDIVSIEACSLAYMRYTCTGMPVTDNWVHVLLPACHCLTFDRFSKSGLGGGCSGHVVQEPLLQHSPCGRRQLVPSVMQHGSSVTEPDWRSTLQRSPSPNGPGSIHCFSPPEKLHTSGLHDWHPLEKHWPLQKSWHEHTTGALCCTRKPERPKRPCKKNTKGL